MSGQSILRSVGNDNTQSGSLMADVTDVPGPPVTEDDEVVLLGAQGSQRITAFELAATCETISYEILTGLSRRLPRVYHAAGSPVEIRLLAGGRSEWRESSSRRASFHSPPGA